MWGNNRLNYSIKKKLKIQLPTRDLFAKRGSAQKESLPNNFFIANVYARGYFHLISLLKTRSKFKVGCNCLKGFRSSMKLPCLVIIADI